MSITQRGVLAGLAGAAAMTAFQKLVEMPLTGREDSYGPADLAERLLPVHPHSAAYALVSCAGLGGMRAVAAVYGTVYPGDVLIPTVLGIYHPAAWSRRDWMTDAGEKLILAAATGTVFDLLPGPGNARQSEELSGCREEREG